MPEIDLFGEGFGETKSHVVNVSKVLLGINQDAEGDYVDVTFCDLKTMHMRHFQIRNGKRWTPKEEKEYLECTLHIFKEPNPKYFDAIIIKVKQLWPEWHVRDYQYFEVGTALEHMYYASHPSGAKGYFYRLNLERIAHCWNGDEQAKECMKEVDSLSQIFPFEVPMKLLKTLNQMDLAEMVNSREQLMEALDVYHEFEKHFEHPLTFSQWRYLEELHLHGEALETKGFQKTLFKRLGEQKLFDLYELYEEYLSLRKELTPYISMRNRDWPKPDRVKDRVYVMKRVKQSLYEADEINEKIKVRSREAEFSYEDDNYFIVEPQDVVDFYNEAEGMGNCIMQYMKSHAEGETTILFLRRKHLPDKPFVDVEINKDGVLTQAYARFNRPCGPEASAFLQEYCARKQLLFSKKVV